MTQEKESTDSNKKTLHGNHIDIDKTNRDLHVQGNDSAAIFTSIVELQPQKMSVKKQYQEVCMQQQMIMNEVFDLYDNLLFKSQ